MVSWLRNTAIGLVFCLTTTAVLGQVTSDSIRVEPAQKVSIAWDELEGEVRSSGQYMEAVFKNVRRGDVIEVISTGTIVAPNWVVFTPVVGGEDQDQVKKLAGRPVRLIGGADRIDVGFCSQSLFRVNEDRDKIVFKLRVQSERSGWILDGADIIAKTIGRIPPEDDDE